MEIQNAFVSVVLTWTLLVVCVVEVENYPTGADNAACFNMTPNHGVEPQDTSTSPFTVTVEEGVTKYSAGTPVQGIGTCSRCPKLSVDNACQFQIFRTNTDIYSALDHTLFKQGRVSASCPRRIIS